MRYITILFLFISSLSFGADRYWVGGGSSANWNATGPTNWAATSGGAGNQTVPGASDNVFFDANGNSASTISATITVLSLTIDAGYTATMTHSAVLTIAGNVTFGANYTIAGASNITISATSTITSNGKTWPNSVTLSGTSQTRTLSGNFVISGSLSISGSTSNIINATTSETISANGINPASFATTGTAKIILTGGTWSASSGAIQNNMDIQGNVTVSGAVAYNTGTLTYVSGTVTTTGSTLTIAASTTLNTAGITWNNITLTTTATLTLNSLLTATGTATISSGVAMTFAGSFGFTFHTLTCSHTGAGIQTLNDGVTYTITNAFNGFLSRNGASLSFTSDHASNTAELYLTPGATCNVLANFTRITNGGRPIRTFNGTVTSCTGVISFNDIGTNKH